MGTMNLKRLQFRKTMRWLIIGLPLAAIPVASLLPLRSVYQQALIGVIFVWFQFSLLLGVLTQ
jgi:hypothetical protein